MTTQDHVASPAGSRAAAEIRGDGITVTPARDDIGVVEARRRFGGVDIPATLAGTVAALGTAVLIAGVLGGAGRVGYQRGIKGTTTSLSIGGLVAGLVTLLLAFLVGGWVAGRMSRYDGARNGFLTAVWFVVLAAAVAGLGAWVGRRYNFFDQVHLPQWFSHNATGAGAIATGVVAVAIMLVAGLVGGKLGERFHRRADALIVHTRDGGLVSRPVAR